MHRAQENARTDHRRRSPDATRAPEKITAARRSERREGEPESARGRLAWSPLAMARAASGHPQAKELASLAFEGFTMAVAQADGWANVHANLSVRFGEPSALTAPLTCAPCP